MASELKPCPFCGSNRIAFRSTPDMDTDGKFHSISCNECGAKSREKFAIETCPLFYEELRNAWNTRPTPTPCDELETVAWQCSLDGLEWSETLIPKARERRNYKLRELVTRSQAEELLAAKDEKIDLAEASAIEMHQDLNKLEADNAALTVRVKELEKDCAHWKANHDSMVAKNGILSQRPDLPVDRLPAIRKLEALETQLAAAKKALEWYEEHVSNCRKIGSIGDPSRAKLDRDGGAIARAALEAKP